MLCQPLKLNSNVLDGIQETFLWEAMLSPLAQTKSRRRIMLKWRLTSEYDDVNKDVTRSNDAADLVKKYQLLFSMIERQ